MHKKGEKKVKNELAGFWEANANYIAEMGMQCGKMICAQLSRESKKLIANGEVNLGRVLEDIVEQRKSERNQQKLEHRPQSVEIERPKYDAIQFANVMCLGISEEQMEQLNELANQITEESLEDEEELLNNIARQMFEIFDGSQVNSIEDYRSV